MGSVFCTNGLGAAEDSTRSHQIKRLSSLAPPRRCLNGQALVAERGTCFSSGRLVFTVTEGSDLRRPELHADRLFRLGSFQCQLSSAIPKRLPLARIVLHHWRTVWIRQQLGVKPRGREVLPSGIHRLDQGHSSLPYPMLDFFLPSNRAVHVPKRLKIDQSMNTIVLREPIEPLCLVLENANVEVVCYARVQHTRLARHDVNKKQILTHGNGKSRSSAPQHKLSKFQNGIAAERGMTVSYKNGSFCKDHEP